MKICGNYLSNYEWLANVTADENVILCRRSALMCLSLFSGYMYDDKVEAYCLEVGNNENINYHLVNSFDDFEIIQTNTLRFTSATQTFNDMLSDFDNVDEQSLIEGLSNYYFDNNQSFAGLSINEKNENLFNQLKEYAIEYYSEG